MKSRLHDYRDRPPDQSCRNKPGILSKTRNLAASQGSLRSWDQQRMKWNDITTVGTRTILSRSASKPPSHTVNPLLWTPPPPPFSVQGASLHYLTSKAKTNGAKNPAPFCLLPKSLFPEFSIFTRNNVTSLQYEMRENLCKDKKSWGRIEGWTSLSSAPFGYYFSDYGRVWVLSETLQIGFSFLLRLRDLYQHFSGGSVWLMALCYLWLSVILYLFPLVLSVDEYLIYQLGASVWGKKKEIKRHLVVLVSCTGWWP